MEDFTEPKENNFCVPFQSGPGTAGVPLGAGLRSEPGHREDLPIRRQDQSM